MYVQIHALQIMQHRRNVQIMQDLSNLDKATGSNLGTNYRCTKKRKHNNTHELINDSD